jgi:outer membrane protein
MIGTGLPWLFAAALQAQSAVPEASAPAVIETAAVAAPADNRPERRADEVAAPTGDPPASQSRWFVRAGALRALYNSDATIATNGAVIPGATARVTNNSTLVFDIGYDLSDRFAVMLMGGAPPRPAVIGKGSAASFGTLGAVRYGPVFLTGVYRFPEWRGFRPYAGAGAARAFILKDFDGAVTRLKVHDNWGVALQAGVEYRLDRTSELFVDYKRLWLNVKAGGRLANAPVRARVTLDPDVVSVGFKRRFD